jgi:hypothetical protein
MVDRALAETDGLIGWATKKRHGSGPASRVAEALRGWLESKDWGSKG